MKCHLFHKKGGAETSVSNSAVTSATFGEETHQDQLFSMSIPKETIYTHSVISETGQQTSPYRPAWITVIGIITGRLNEVIDFFSKYGPIKRVNDTPGNWAYLEFETYEMAEAAVADCSQGPQLISGSMAVSCVMGRRVSDYVADDIGATEDASLEPIAEVVEPKVNPWSARAIYDALFK